MASTDATPFPKKNVAYRVTFPLYDADGDLVTGATGLDSEVSKDGGTFADCTNEATEIATSSGMYYLDLTSTEMNADTVAVIVKTSTSGAKTTALVFYPEEAGDIRVDVTMISGDATAADNAEAFFDGTGYAGTNNVIPTVTAVSNMVTANVTQISGDAAAADNLEAYTDGTTPMPVNATQISGSATAADNVEVVFATDFAANYNTTLDQWVVNVTNIEGVDATNQIRDAVTVDTSGVTTLLSRLSATRAGYLDNLSVGAVAQASALSTLDGKIGTPSDLGGGATLAQNLSDIESQTDDIGAAGAGLTALGDSRLANLDAAVSSRSTYAGGDTSGTTTLLGRLTSTRAGYLDNLSAGAVATAAALATVDTIADKLDTALELDGAVWRFTTNALELAPVTSAAPSVSDIADEVQTRTIAAVTVVNGLAANSVTASALASDAVTEIQSGLATSSAVSALPTAIDNADALLNRDLSTGTDSGSTTVRTPRQALRFLRNRWAISGGVLTVYKEDDATSSWSAAATQTAGDPVSEIDPGGP